MDTPSIDLEIGANIDPLKASLAQAETMLRALDQSTARHAQSIGQTLAKLIGSNLGGRGSGRRGVTALEQLAAPLINQVLNNVIGQFGEQMFSRGGQPVNIAMNVATPDANSFRMSQGQILAEAAAAIARATKRFL
jgi:hypothetical protein